MGHNDPHVGYLSVCIFLFVDENLCAKNPCKNGGTCQRIGGDFYCECGTGFAGRYCENSTYGGLMRFLRKENKVSDESEL